MRKIVTVSVTTQDGKDNGPTAVTIEQDRGAGFLRVGGRDITTNRDKEQVFELEPGQRLVIDSWPAEEVVMDREQGAAVLRSNQKQDKVADSAVEGKSASDLRAMADELDRKQREEREKAQSQANEAKAASDKAAAEAAKTPDPNARTANADVAKNPSTPSSSKTAGRADATNPMKSSKDV